MLVRPLHLLLVCFLFACGARGEPEGPREPSVAEGLVYRVSAALAKVGLHVRCQGVMQSGLAMRMAQCEVASRRGLLRARDLTLRLQGEPTRLPLFFLPSLAVSAREIALVRGREQPAGEAKSAKRSRRLPHVIRAMPVRVDVAQLRLRELPVVVAASAFGWPFAEAPHGEVHVGAKDLRLSAHVQRDDGRAVGHVALATPSLSKLTKLFGKKGAVVSGGSALSLIEIDMEDGAVIGKLAGAARDLCVVHPRFGAGRACGIQARGAMRFGASRHQVYMDLGVLSFGARSQLEIAWSGAVPLDGDGGPLDLDIRLPAQPVERVLAAIPDNWRTGLHGFEMAGTFSARFRVSEQSGEFQLDPTFGFANVSVRNAPAGQDPRRLNGPALLKLAFPYPHTVSLAPEDGFVPISQLPTVLVDAVRISEDANFFGHDGFDRTEIARALVDIKEGHGARGASTISQQLAKNLYFDGDRNLTRKVEEAIATAALEGSVPKWRLLEIYLNIIEWGDGIFGVGAAARRYFQKPARELGAEEAVFLAGIIPAPRKVDREMAKLGTSAWAEKRALRVTRFLCHVGKLDGPPCEGISSDPSIAGYDVREEP